MSRAQDIQLIAYIFEGGTLKSTMLDEGGLDNHAALEAHPGDSVKWGSRGFTDYCVNRPANRIDDETGGVGRSVYRYQDRSTERPRIGAVGNPPREAPLSRKRSECRLPELREAGNRNCDRSVLKCVLLKNGRQHPVVRSCSGSPELLAHDNKYRYPTTHSLLRKVGQWH
jgi:hypothetical protein